jgi:hypothetical protein
MHYAKARMNERFIRVFLLSRDPAYQAWARAALIVTALNPF